MYLFTHVLQTKHLLPCGPLHSITSFELFIQLAFAELLQGVGLLARVLILLSVFLFNPQKSFLPLCSEVPAQNIISHDRCLSMCNQSGPGLCAAVSLSKLVPTQRLVSPLTHFCHFLAHVVRCCHRSKLIFFGRFICELWIHSRVSPPHDLNCVPGGKSDACFSIPFPSASKNAKERLAALGKEAQ